MSRIPEGATHWAKDPRCHSTNGTQYYKFSGKNWFYWPENFDLGVWHPCSKPVAKVQPISQDEERQATLAHLVQLIEGADAADKTIAEAIYDAGYRKP